MRMVGWSCPASIFPSKLQCPTIPFSFHATSSSIFSSSNSRSPASIQSISPWMAVRREVFLCSSNISPRSNQPDMSFSDLQEQQGPAQLLQRSLERGRLGHAYLFAGSDLLELAEIARTLAETRNCQV